jgi:L-cysteine desulfidase
LKNLGFKTFNHWFDESYDDEPNSDKRSLMITNILKQFDEMPLDKLKTIRDEMKSVCEHNQNMFKQYYENKYGENNINKEISNVIDEIWDSL